MAEQTPDGISWAHYTFNTKWGCVEIGDDPACGPTEEFPQGARCYARIWAERCGYNDKPPADGKEKKLFPIWGQDALRRQFGEKHWNQLFEWNRKAHRRRLDEIRAIAVDSTKDIIMPNRDRVFVESMGDWAEGRPEQASDLERLWEIIRACESLDFLMLTKRTQLISKLCPIVDNPRVWQGTTVANKKWMNIRAPYLRDVQAIIKWFSMEPLVEAVDLPQWFLDMGPRAWVVVGGQSAMGQPQAEPIPFHEVGARRILAQCREAGVRFHMKQMSGRRKEELKAIPADLMIREYPEAA